jgi:hypothetical protein
MSFHLGGRRSEDCPFFSSPILPIPFIPFIPVLYNLFSFHPSFVR